MPTLWLTPSRTEHDTSKPPFALKPEQQAVIDGVGSDYTINGTIAVCARIPGCGQKTIAATLCHADPTGFEHLSFKRAMGGLEASTFKSRWGGVYLTSSITRLVVTHAEQVPLVAWKELKARFGNRFPMAVIIGGPSTSFPGKLKKTGKNEKQKTFELCRSHRFNSDHEEEYADFLRWLARPPKGWPPEHVTMFYQEMLVLNRRTKHVLQDPEHVTEIVSTVGRTRKRSFDFVNVVEDPHVFTPSKGAVDDSSAFVGWPGARIVFRKDHVVDDTCTIAAGTLAKIDTIEPDKSETHENTPVVRPTKKTVVTVRVGDTIHEIKGMRPSKRRRNDIVHEEVGATWPFSPAFCMAVADAQGRELDRVHVKLAPNPPASDVLTACSRVSRDMSIDSRLKLENLF